MKVDFFFSQTQWILQRREEAKRREGGYMRMNPSQYHEESTKKKTKLKFWILLDWSSSIQGYYTIKMKNNNWGYNGKTTQYEQRSHKIEQEFFWGHKERDWKWEAEASWLTGHNTLSWHKREAKKSVKKITILEKRDKMFWKQRNKIQIDPFHR